VLCSTGGPTPQAPTGTNRARVPFPDPLASSEASECLIQPLRRPWLVGTKKETKVRFVCSVYPACALLAVVGLATRRELGTAIPGDGPRFRWRGCLCGSQWPSRRHRTTRYRLFCSEKGYDRIATVAQGHHRVQLRSTRMLLSAGREGASKPSKAPTKTTGEEIVRVDSKFGRSCKRRVLSPDRRSRGSLFLSPRKHTKEGSQSIIHLWAGAGARFGLHRDGRSTRIPHANLTRRALCQHPL